jgi:hypothetical protein
MTVVLHPGLAAPPAQIRPHHEPRKLVLTGSELEAAVPWKRKKDQLPPAPQSVRISGIRNSAIAVGTGNYTVQGSAVESGPAEAQLDEALAAVRYLVQERAGDQAQLALGQVAALDRAAKADPPDVTTIVRVREWFGRHLPFIVPAVLEVLAHPSIDTAIKAAGQIAQAEVTHRPDPGSED